MCPDHTAAMVAIDVRSLALLLDAQIRMLAWVHIGLAVVLLLNYSIGTALVTINRGWKWKEMVDEGLIQLPFEGPLRLMYIMGGKMAPEWLWSASFLLCDFWFLYYLSFLAFSICGALVSIKFFAFHVLDLATRIRLLNYVMQSVTANIGQVLATLVLGILLCYIYAIIGLSFFGWNR